MDEAPIHGRKQRALMALAHLVCRRALWIVLAAVALAVASIIYTALELEFITDRNALVSPDAAYNQRYMGFMEAFGDQEPMMLLIGDASLRKDGLIVDADPPVPDKAARERMKQAASRVVARLEQRPDLFPQVIERIPPDEFDGTRMLYLPHQDLHAIAGQLEQAKPLLHGIAEQPSFPGLLAALRDSVEQGAGELDDSAEAGNELHALLRDLNTSLRAATGTPAAFDLFEFESSNSALDPDGYMFLWDGRLLYAAMHPAREPGALDQWKEPVAFARAAVAGVQTDFPELAIGLGGRPVIYSDEMAASGRDMAIATIFAVLAVGLMFVFAFRSLRRPALAVLCLLLALCWTFGVTTLVVGHLNIFAMVFAVVLVGLGIDFGIHLLSHYRHGISHGLSVHDALVETYAEIGMGTVLGAVTTAAALSTAAFTDFLGLAELGLICGWGIGFCLVAMLVVFPAMLVILDSRRIGEGNQALRAAMRELQGPPPQRPATSRKARIAALAVGGLILAAAVLSVAHIAGGWAPFAYNMLDLNDPKSEAVQWERLLIEHDQRSSYAVSVSGSIAELRERRAEFEALVERGIVASTESLLPESEQAKRDILAGISSQLPEQVNDPDTASTAAELRSAARGLQAALRQLASRGPTLQAAFEPAITELSALIELIRQRGDHVSARLGELEPQFFGALTQSLRELNRDANPPAVAAATLPQALRTRYVGEGPEGLRYALYVYPSGDGWDREVSGAFNEAVLAIDPQATGVTIQVYEAGTRIANGFALSVLYAAIAIVLLLLLDLRRPLALMVALIPVLASLSVLLALMTLTKLSFNFANFFGVPILIGTTVDAGVYLVHSQRHGDPRRTLRQTRKACLLCGMTTLLGFGALITASHQGIVSLGVVLVTGSIAGMLGSVVVVPALLAWFNERGKRV